MLEKDCNGNEVPLKCLYINLLSYKKIVLKSNQSLQRGNNFLQPLDIFDKTVGANITIFGLL